MRLLRSVLHLGWMLVTVIPWGLALLILSLRLRRAAVVVCGELDAGGDLGHPGDTGHSGAAQRA